MKVFIKCKSPLLEKTLKNFLKDIEVNDIKDATICISDTKIKYHDTFIVGKDITHPFTKSMLLFEMANFLKFLENRAFEKKLNTALKDIKNTQNKKINNLIKKIR